MPILSTKGAASASGFGGVGSGPSGGGAGPAAIVYPNTVVGFPDEFTSSYDSTVTNGVVYTTPYDGKFINEWDILGEAGPGGNGKWPGNLSSPLSRSVPTTLTALKQNAHRDGSSGVAVERQGWALFVVGRDCPDTVNRIGVVAYGGGGENQEPNYASAEFDVSAGEAFRVVVAGGATSTGAYDGGNGVGAGGGDGDNGNRGGGGASGFWYCGIEQGLQNDSTASRILIAGGGGNNRSGLRNLSNANNSAAGDGYLDGSTNTVYGLQPGQNGPEHAGGGPGGGGSDRNEPSSGSAQLGGAYNTGIGQSHNFGSGQLQSRGMGGGTGGNGGQGNARTNGGAGGFAYNRVGLGGGSGLFGGGGGWQGGGGGWGGSGSPGSSKVMNGNGGSIVMYDDGQQQSGNLSNGGSLSSLTSRTSGLPGRPSQRASGYVAVLW